MTRIPVETRFWRYVSPEPNTGCWLWEGAATAAGYGMLMIDRATNERRLASHVSLKMDGRPRPSGAFACHHCDIPSCVNPEHLYWGNPVTNAADSMRRGRFFLPPARGRRGEANPKTKLTPEQVRIIRDTDVSTYVLAERFGVSQAAVWYVRKGRSWRDD